MKNIDYDAGKESQKFNLKKPTRKEMEASLSSLDDLLMANFRDDYALGVAVAKLHKYFAAKDPAKTVASDDVKWVLQAVAKTVVKKAMQVAKIMDGKLIAVDGHRMHILSNYTEHEDGALLPNGSWISEAEYKKEYGTFPDYKQVIPRGTHPQPDITFSARPDTKNDLLFTVIENKGMDNQVTETEGLYGTYYKQAIAGMENPSYSAYILGPLVIESADRYAAIMPIRIK